MVLSISRHNFNSHHLGPMRINETCRYFSHRTSNLSAHHVVGINLQGLCHQLHDFHGRPETGDGLCWSLHNKKIIKLYNCICLILILNLNLILVVWLSVSLILFVLWSMASPLLWIWHSLSFLMIDQQVLVPSCLWFYWERRTSQLAVRDSQLRTAWLWFLDDLAIPLQPSLAILKSIVIKPCSWCEHDWPFYGPFLTITHSWSWSITICIYLPIFINLYHH